MSEKTYNVLFLCTGNSARSILAEALVNRIGEGRFRGFSAGSRPVGQVNPFALDLLRRRGHPTERLRSKSWNEFARPNSPPLDFVITVCDNAAGEACPIWPGRPITDHWGLPDPAVIADEDARRAAFDDTYRGLERRIAAFVELANEDLDNLTLRQRTTAAFESA